MRVELTVEETILAILHQRDWGMSYDQIAGDLAWSIVTDSSRGELDYDHGLPTSRTLDDTLLQMVEGRILERHMTAPLTFLVSRSSRLRAAELSRRVADCLY